MGLGNESTAVANVMVARVVAIVMVIAARGGRWLIEQPATSLLSQHVRWQWLLRSGTMRIFKTAFCMGAYGGSTAKPTCCWSADDALLGALHRCFERSSFVPLVNTTTVKRGPKGRRLHLRARAQPYMHSTTQRHPGELKVTGIKEHLKSTQPGPYTTRFAAFCER